MQKSVRSISTGFYVYVMTVKRLIDHLKETGLSNREATDLMTTGKVFYRNIPTSDAARVVEVAHVSIRRTAPRIQPGRDLSILYRDPHLVVIHKPPGLLSVPSGNRRNEPNVLATIGRLCGSSYPVHRLDEGTSGLMMVALTQNCQTLIKEKLFVHDVDRRYLAVVRGVFPSTSKTVRSFFVRDRGDGLRGSAVHDDKDKREAVTHLRIVEACGRNASLVEAQLETGRTHQVRIHLAESKHPILGDTLYADRAVAGLAPRLALHAYRLALRHPVTREEIAFEAPLPDDLEALCRRLRGVGSAR